MHVRNIHGYRLEDPWFWLREKENPEVLKFLERENERTQAHMAPTKELQETLYQECLARIQETDSRPPFPWGSHLYWSRTEEGKQYRIYCRAPRVQPEQAETVLDLNELAENQPYMALGNYEVSDDGNWLAYSTDNTGYRQYRLHFLNLRTRQVHPTTIERVTSVAWLPDNATVLFTTEDEVTKRSDRSWLYKLQATEPEPLYTEDDELFDLSASRSKEGPMLFLHSWAKTSDEVRYARADNPRHWSVFRPREEDHEYSLDHKGDTFYILTNQDATNFKLCTAPEADPTGWTELVPHNPEVKLDGFDLFANHVALSQRRKGTQELRILPNDYLVEVPDPVRSLDLGVGKIFETTTLRYHFESPVTPGTVYEMDMDTKETVILKRDPVLGDYRDGDYACERREFPARDGTPIPVTLVYKKDLDLTRPNPMLLYGYGSYGVSYDPSFSSNRLSLLKRGLIYAIAHIRGGGELGEEWRQAGRLERKMTTFHDFIDVAEGLIKTGLTKNDRLVAQGGSAGGLLMGVVANQRPDLWKAMVSQVPFVDVINTMLDDTLPLTTSEYSEWGDPREKAAFETMLAYSPYDNIKAQDYPAMLVKVGFHDSQVPYWEGAKLVARLRERKTDDNVILLHTNLTAGHGGASGRYDYLREVAFDYAYVLSVLIAD